MTPKAACSPGASLMSSAVRMRAISVDVKWTVMSSLEIGMFMRTRRWGQGTGQGQATRFPQDHSAGDPGGWAGFLGWSPQVPGQERFASIYNHPWPLLP